MGPPLISGVPAYHLEPGVLLPWNSRELMIAAGVSLVVPDHLEDEKFSLFSANHPDYSSY
jgi:hypothetical protein